MKKIAMLISLFVLGCSAPLAPVMVDGGTLLGDSGPAPYVQCVECTVLIRGEDFSCQPASQFVSIERCAECFVGCGPTATWPGQGGTCSPAVGRASCWEVR